MGDLGWIRVSGISPGEGNGNSPQYSCLENSLHRGAWEATVWGHRVRHDRVIFTIDYWKYIKTKMFGCPYQEKNEEILKHFILYIFIFFYLFLIGDYLLYNIVLIYFKT